MRFPISLLVLGAIAASLGVSEAAPVRKIVPQGATNFNSKQHCFAVWLPSKPLESSGGWFLGGGNGIENQKPTSFNFETKTKAIRYQITVSARSPDSSSANTRKELVVMQQKFLDALKDKFQIQQEIQLAGFWGRKIQANWLNGSRTTRARLYLTPNKSYEIVASGPKAEMQKQATQINRVFDSFRILPQ